MSSATDRKRRQREREASGVRSVRVSVSDEFGGYAVEAGLITEQDALTRRGFARGIEMAVEEWMRDCQESREAATEQRPGAWFTYSKSGPALTFAEKQAWLQSQGLMGASRDEIAQAIRANKLEFRWFGRTEPAS
jgi:hypothetical protein